MENKEIDQLLFDENEHLNKLHKIVKDTLEEEELIIHNLLYPPLEILSPGQKISDKVARFGGSWKFIILFGIILTLWIVFNVIAIGHYKFDPYPFILMNLILSCIAALQAPVIMMSQNRQEEKDRMRNENDYLINLKGRNANPQPASKNGFIIKRTNQNAVRYTGKAIFFVERNKSET